MGVSWETGARSQGRCRQLTFIESPLHGGRGSKYPTHTPARQLFTITLWEKHCYEPHFRNEKTGPGRLGHVTEVTQPVSK